PTTGDRSSRRSNAPMRFRDVHLPADSAVGVLSCKEPPAAGTRRRVPANIVSRGPRRKNRLPYRPKNEALRSRDDGILAEHDPPREISCEGCTKILVCPWHRTKATEFLQQFIRKKDTPCLASAVAPIAFFIVVGISYRLMRSFHSPL